MLPLVFRDELVVDIGRHFGMSVPHLGLSIFQIGAGEAQPVVLRAKQHQPVHPAHAEMAAGGLDEAGQLVIVAHGFPVFHRLKTRRSGATSSPPVADGVNERLIAIVKLAQTRLTLRAKAQ